MEGKIAQIQLFLAENGNFSLMDNLNPIGF